MTQENNQTPKDAESNRYIIINSVICEGCGFHKYEVAFKYCIIERCFNVTLKNRIEAKAPEYLKAKALADKKAENIKIAEADRELYAYYVSNCEKDGEKPISYDKWLSNKYRPENIADRGANVPNE